MFFTVSCWCCIYITHRSFERQSHPILNGCLRRRKTCFFKSASGFAGRIEMLLSGDLNTALWSICLLKGTPWDETFSILSILKIYLMWSYTAYWSYLRIQKKSKNYLKAPKKSEIVKFPGRILPCKQNRSAIYSTLNHIFPRLGRGDQSNRP